MSGIASFDQFNIPSPTEKELEYVRRKADGEEELSEFLEIMELWKKTIEIVFVKVV